MDNDQFLLIGLTSLVAAIGGGNGFRFMGLEIPALTSIRQQIMLGLLGLVLISPFLITKVSAVNKTNQCESYAIAAKSQFELGIENSCGFKGERWHNSFAGHHGWCLTQGDASIESEDHERNKALTLCANKSRR